MTLLDTCVFETSADGKIDLKLRCSVMPTAAESPQPESVARFLIVSPLPREMSLASASRFVSMNAAALSKMWTAMQARYRPTIRSCAG